MSVTVKKIELRHLKMSDYLELKDSMIEAYESWQGTYWKEHHIQKLLDIFPDGQIVVLGDGKVVGCAFTLIIDYDDFDEAHTYREITGNYTFDTHSPKGDVLYGIEVFIRPEYRGLRMGRRLYDARKELCERLNLKAIVFGGRIPGYHDHADSMTPREYINKVQHKEIYDPVLTFQLSNDFHVRKVLKGYMPGDEDSQDYAVLLEWNNIYFNRSKQISQRKSIVRIGLVQWQMRPLNGVEALYDQIEFFVDAVSGYQCDFVLFPELFNAPLMAAYNDFPESEAIRKLAEHTIPIKNKFKEFAMSYNINIITGSMPMVDDGKLYNVGFLCRRDGSEDIYYKIHPTPNEVSYWGITGGNKLVTFNTDCCRIGILICYDVEFPELPRLLADEGLQILFVPFLTDTQNGFTRVKHCSQARAIENECYVAIAGAVGNLPRVNNMDIQFAQSAVFTPSDFQFPTNGVKAEATPNSEMTLIADVDLDLLKQLHNFGSVKTLSDRRKDLYDVIRVK